MGCGDERLLPRPFVKSRKAVVTLAHTTWRARVALRQLAVPVPHVPCHGVRGADLQRALEHAHGAVRDASTCVDAMADCIE